MDNPGESAGNSSVKPFAKGNSVTIHGLRSQAEYNGDDGVVLQYVEKSGRYKVKVRLHRNILFSTEMLPFGWISC
eukprot:SAG31_NODE_235_length_19695_cov_37.959790_2_plen_75_part_00